MSVNGLNVGTDYEFGLYDANSGTVLEIGDIQSIDEKANKHDIKSMPYNGQPVFGYISDGYSGSFSIVRTSSQMEKLQIVLSNQFNNGVPVKAGYLNKRVTDPDGSVSKFQYTRVTFFLTDIGNVSREKTVIQTITWMASDKQQLA